MSTMNLKTRLVLVFLSAEVIFATNDVEVKSERLQIPSVNANCTTKDLPAKCCASIVLPTGSKKLACVALNIPSNMLAVNVNVVFNDKSFANFTIGGNPAPICVSLRIGGLQLCLTLTDHVTLKKGYAKICSALVVRSHSATVFRVIIPCLEYKNKKFSVILQV